MADIALDRSHFGNHEPRIGDSVCIHLPRKIVPWQAGFSSSVTYMVTNIDPLLAKPVSVTHVIGDLSGCPYIVKTRRIRGR